MASDSDLTTLEPDLIGVVRNDWKLIGAIAVAVGLLGLFVGTTRSAEWRATASVVVEDPRNSTLFEGGPEQKPERYVETQIGILASPAVAQKASDLLALGNPAIVLDADEILAGTVVSAEQSSDLISVSYTGDTEEQAELTADALITAYLELRQSEAVEGFSAALDQLDESIASSEQELEDLDASIKTFSESPVMIDLQQQHAAAFARLNELENSEEAVDLVEVELISKQLNAIEAAIRIEEQRPELATLLEEQGLAIARHSSLVTRRNEVAVDAELAGGGFVFQSPARPATRANPGPRTFALVGGALGILVGIALAYGSAVRRRRVDSPEEPELLLRSPFLGAIPVFDGEMDTPLPVANAPESQAAEAFGFVMAAVESQLSRADVAAYREGERVIGDRTVFVTSPAAEDGRSTVVANMAIAAARSGKRVLVLDADFGTQGVTSMLFPEAEGSTGITEVVIGASGLDRAIREVPLGAGLELFLLSRGSDVLSAQDLFGSTEAAEVIQRVRDDFDLVLVDSPPFLQVGYATTLARLADRVLVVIPNRTLVSSIEELRKRLSLIHSRDIGYVYNRATGLSHVRRTGRHVRHEPSQAFDEAESSLAPLLESLHD